MGPVEHPVHGQQDPGDQGMGRAVGHQVQVFEARVPVEREEHRGQERTGQASSGGQAVAPGQGQHQQGHAHRSQRQVQQRDEVHGQQRRQQGRRDHGWRVERRVLRVGQKRAASVGDVLPQGQPSGGQGLSHDLKPGQVALSRVVGVEEQIVREQLVMHRQGQQGHQQQHGPQRSTGRSGVRLSR